MEQRAEGQKERGMIGTILLNWLPHQSIPEYQWEN